MDIAGTPSRSRPAMIRLEHLTKIYDLPPDGGGTGQVIAAEGVNLDIPSGEIFGLVGPNGAGKTTTLKMLCGLLVPTAGRVTVNGVDVERHPEDAQRHIGYLADFFSLYDDLKVWEYLDYFARAYKIELRAISARVDYAIGVMGLEAKRGAFISGLSRGMKQRLGIARTILHDPPVLVLDEPAAGLDPNARVDFKQLIRNLHREGKTVFITSHLLADLEELCTSVGIMEKGRLVRAGPLEQIVREATGTRTIRLRLASPEFALISWMGAQPGVVGVQPDASGARFRYAGSDTDLAVLVRALVTAGAQVYAVEEVTETLEQAFSRLSRGEVT